MTWQSFFTWLEANGVRYFAGDLHFAGRAWWFPLPPELDGSENPLPPEPWLRVTEDRETRSVFVETSFPVLGSTSTYAETPEAALATVSQVLLAYDTYLGVESLPPPRGPRAFPRWYEPQVQARALPGRLIPIPDEAWEQLNQRIERLRREAKERIERFVAECRPDRGRGDSREALQSRVDDPTWRYKPDLKGYDEGVSPSCDLGHHRRCRGCACSCHR